MKRGLGAIHSTASPDSIDDARFAPGHVLGGRYRIVGLLGRGGMGEVYRADDLALKQPVALKLLPEAISGDSAALERLRREVRVARQISHPNVCRVYDIGETDGLHFLSMELIRGDELASVLKRFGRLPADKATEIARQICAGLAVAHKAGVLHRDLKPANVMIDETGDARITDFGLAALAEDVRGDELAGTPAYMSPEQLAGRELTTKSDIYSLGLVLYELYTGKRAFDARTLPELLRLRQSDTTPTSPASLVKDLDPLVERVILRCLERDPKNRPASALQVAAALPGGDPLAAALAAGETPSPEMVAAAPKEGALRPAAAAGLLASVFIMLALICLLSGKTMLYRRVPLEKPTEVLRERAGEIVRRLGYAEAPTDSADGFYSDLKYLGYVAGRDSSPARWDKLPTGEPPVILYWYRQSPRYLESENVRVTRSDPPRGVSGMAGVSLDTRGRLRHFYAVPPQLEGAGQPPASATAWPALFEMAGLDYAGFRQVESVWVPETYADERAAWEGAYPEQTDIPIRVEAAGYRGRAVYFDVRHPWDEPLSQGQRQAGTGERVFSAILITVFLTVLAGGVVLAVRNLRTGRGDRRGATRLAVFILALTMFRWAFTAHHVPTGHEFDLFILGLEGALFLACFFWVVYVALEPFVRRWWPELIISWSRLLAGDWRDPLVGRDVLIGAAFGLGMILNIYVAHLVPPLLGWPPDRPILEPSQELLGFRYFPSAFGMQIQAGLLLSFIPLFFLLLVFIVVRRARLAAAVTWLVGVVLTGLISDAAHPVGWLFAAVSAFLTIFALYRFGLLAGIASVFFFHTFVWFPITTELTAWYATGFALDLLVMAALALYGFYTSLAGQPLLRGDLLGD